MVKSLHSINWYNLCLICYLFRYLSHDKNKRCYFNKLFIKLVQEVVRGRLHKQLENSFDKCVCEMKINVRNTIKRMNPAYLR